MIRKTVWVVFYLLTFCTIDIYVKYTDGLTINIKGWVTPLQKWWKNRQEAKDKP